MMFQWILLAAAVAYAAKEEEDKLVDKLLEGEVAKAFTLRMFSCSAVLIARDWALSAGHCFDNLGKGVETEHGDKLFNDTASLQSNFFVNAQGTESLEEDMGRKEGMETF